MAKNMGWNSIATNSQYTKIICNERYINSSKTFGRFTISSPLDKYVIDDMTFITNRLVTTMLAITLGGNRLN